MTVTDAGSSLIVDALGVNGFAFVGLRGSGELSVLAGASAVLDVEFVNIGSSVGSDGTVLVDGAGSSLIVGAGGVDDTAAVGQEGTGTLNVLAGASASFLVAATDVGATGGSNGTLLVDQGSTLTTSGDFQVALGIFDDGGTPGDLSDDFGQNAIGVANVDILNGGSIDVGDFMSVGQTPLGDGTVDIGVFGNAGSAATLTVAQTLTIGHGDGAIPGTQSGVVNVNVGSTLTATEIVIEDGGVLNVQTGATVNGIVTLAGGVQNTGLSPGTAVLTGDYIIEAGTLETEFAGTAAGQFDLVQVSGQASLLGGLLAFSMIDGYAPAAGDSFAFLTADGGLTAYQEDLSVVVRGVTLGFDFDLDFGANEALFTVLNGAGAGDSSLFYGGSGDDIFTGGDGDDLLSGGAGADVLTGGGGADIFALGTADIFSDFEDGTDLIGLEAGMEYSDLLIQGADGGTTIALQASGDILAMLNGITPNLLDQSDFVAMA
jgi:T5SS/PEP-CTERM-associated repeat protein